MPDTAARSAPSKSPHTVRDAPGSARTTDVEDARTRMFAELEQHFDETLTVTIEARPPGSRFARVGKAIEVAHPGEGENLTSEARDVLRSTELAHYVERLVDQVFEACETAAEQSPVVVRIRGYGDRVGIPLWTLPQFVAGEPFGTPHAQRDESLSRSLIEQARAVESMARTVDRVLRTDDERQKSSLSLFKDLTASVKQHCEDTLRLTAATCNQMIEASKPSVAIKVLENAGKRDQHAHLERIAEEHESNQLLGEAMKIVASALLGGGARPAGDPEHCEASQTLAGVLSRTPENKAKIDALLTEDERSAINKAAACPTVEEFDACFGVLWNEFQRRGRDGFTELFSELTSIVGADAINLHVLIQEHERRTRRSAD